MQRIELAYFHTLRADAASFLQGAPCDQNPGTKCKCSRAGMCRKRSSTQVFFATSENIQFRLPKRVDDANIASRGQIGAKALVLGHSARRVSDIHLPTSAAVLRRGRSQT